MDGSNERGVIGRDYAKEEKKRLQGFIRHLAPPLNAPSLQFFLRKQVWSGYPASWTYHALLSGPEPVVPWVMVNSSRIVGIT